MIGEAFLEKHALMRFNGLERTTCTSAFNCNHGYGYGGSAFQKKTRWWQSSDNLKKGI